MTQNQQGTFYDGKSSKKITVEVFVEANQIRISTEIVWKFDEIRIVDKPLDGRFGVLTSINFPDARLHIGDSEFFLLIAKQLPNLSFLKRDFFDFIRQNIVLLILVISGIAALPYLAQKIGARNLDPLGNQIVAEIVTEKNRCQNIAGIEEIDRFVQKIEQEKYNIYVIKENQTNAISLPRNNIVIYSKLFDKITSPSQLAFLIGHEIGHIKHQDHKRSYAMSRILILGNKNYFINFVSTIFKMNYSREDEEKADLFALDLMLKNKIDTKGAIELLQILQKEDFDNKNLEKVLSYVSSHPATGDRILELQKRILNRKDDAQEIISEASWHKIKGICQL